MRIGIDARLYGIKSGTGIGRYTQELLAQFLEMTNSQFPIPNIEFTVFLRRDVFEVFPLPNRRWKKVLADFRPYTFRVQTEYPRMIRAAGVDLMHFTHFDHPLRCPAPFVVTIHDLILFSHPSIRASTLGPIRFWAKYLAYRAIIRHAIRSSVAICTPSESVREEIIKNFGVSSDKVITTLLGVDHVSRFQISDFRFQISTFPYILYVGNAYPHKNIEQLIRVWPEVRKLHPDLHLLLVGREDDFSRRFRTAPHDDHVIFHGALGEAELRATIVNAVAYVSPSRNEGFDLPTVEACAFGVPVIASDIPVHREVLGDAGTFFAPDNDTELIHAIRRIIVDNELRGILKIRGRERAKRYRWRTCAERTLNMYSHASTSRSHEASEEEHKEK